MVIAARWLRSIVRHPLVGIFYPAGFLSRKTRAVLAALAGMTSQKGLSWIRYESIHLQDSARMRFLSLTGHISVLEVQKRASPQLDLMYSLYKAFYETG